MSERVGRNDPCTCGSGKKYKNCCMSSHASPKAKKLTAKWLNPRQGPNLMNSVFGNAIESANQEFKPITEAKITLKDESKKEEK